MMRLLHSVESFTIDAERARPLKLYIRVHGLYIRELASISLHSYIASTVAFAPQDLKWIKSMNLVLEPAFPRLGIRH